MKTFSEILQDTATLFLIPALGVEQIVYLKAATEEVVGAGDLKKMATIGVLSGRPASMAVIGVLEKSRSSVSRQILALVNRQPIAKLEGAPHGHSPRLVIEVANSSVSGISSGEINVGRDKVELVVALNETPQELRITEILSHDAGMMRLEVGT